MKSVGRGKGNATNVPERELIDQVRVRPLLYDKNVKDYRKPGASDAAWLDVAQAVGTSVTNCKKRWKSLRDTFIKYYRLDVLYSTGESKRMHKPWNFYRDLTFLKLHVELFRLEDNLKGVNDTGHAFAKETFGISSDNERIVLVEDFGEESQEYKDDDQILNASNSEGFEERIEDPLEEEDYMLAESEVIHQDKLIGKSAEDQFEIYEMMTENEEEVEQNEEVPQLCEPPPQLTEVLAAPTSVLSNKNVVDPDERYLMSCLPAFQRFTPQQKAYVRMGIERLFYEVEFENISEHRNKRSRNS